MATKIQSPLLFLLLLAFQGLVIMSGEAAICETPSRLFRGACFRGRNCGAICEKEGFLNGQCKLLKCICSKDCNTSGGGGSPGQGPPDEEPPEEGPPSEGPPQEGAPGGEEPPVEGPPGERPPEGGPPSGEEPPIEGPPSGEERPVQGPPQGEDLPKKSLLES